MLASIAVALGAWLPSVAMSGLFVLTGVVGFVLLIPVIKKVGQQKGVVQAQQTSTPTYIETH